MKCPNCSAEATGRFCSYCGSEMPREDIIRINGNNNTVIYNGNNKRKEYVPPVLEEYTPLDYEDCKFAIFKKYFIIFLTILGSCILICLSNPMFVFISLIALLFTFSKLCGSYKNKCGEFAEEEREREEQMMERNRQREYDAWFDSLSESEKQTELLKKMVNKDNVNITINQK